jgi:hypothetical protein
MRKLFSVLLSGLFVFYGNPMFAVEKKEPARHYFLLNVNPVDPGRKVDWPNECLLRIKNDERVILSFEKNGRRGHSAEGDLRRGTPLVVGKEDGIVRWVYNCGNDVLSPVNWAPEGVLECAPVEYLPAPKEAKEDIKEVSSEPAPVQKLKLSPPPLPPKKPVLTLGLKKEKSFWRSPWPYVIGVVLIGGVVYALSSKNKTNQPPGGPSKDPPNGPSSGPPN